jgi:hypothetical protein
MSSELNGFTILSSENASDGLMHIQACGTPTGKINIFEIPEDQLEPALKRGFKEFKK